MVFPDDVALPLGSLVLITGVTGFIASVLADELVKRGYRVRGTARDVKSDKASWMPEYFDKTYGSGKFELVGVATLAVEGCLDEAVKGCDAIVHLASNLSFSPDPNIVVKEALAFTRNALEAAVTEPRIKRFVFCSSSSAIQQHRWNEEYDLTPDMWNTVDPPISWAPPPYGPDRVLATYNASKAESEQLFWNFLKERKPGFVGNAVLPDTVLGLPLNPAKQGLGPSAAMMGSLWREEDLWKLFYPQYVVDLKDTVLLHVAGLVAPDVQGERLFGFAWKKRWTDVIPLLREWYPEHQFPDPPEKENYDLANVTARPRAEEVLRWFGEDGFTPMEQSYRVIFDAIRDGVGFDSHVL